MTVQEFCKKIIPFLKKKGIKGIYRKLLEKTNVVSAKNQFLYDFDFLVDDVKIPFEEKEFEIHKNDEVKILNWVIPEMGKGSGGHLNIFRFVSFLEKMGFHSRIYLFRAPSLHDNKSVREFLKENFPILDERVEAYWDVKYAKFAHLRFLLYAKMYVPALYYAWERPTNTSVAIRASTENREFTVPRAFACTRRV